MSQIGKSEIKHFNPPCKLNPHSEETALDSGVQLTPSWWAGQEEETQCGNPALDHQQGHGEQRWGQVISIIRKKELYAIYDMPNVFPQPHYFLILVGIHFLFRELLTSFLAPTGAQEIALSVCPSVPFMNSSLNPHPLFKLS